MSQEFNPDDVEVVPPAMGFQIHGNPGPLFEALAKAQGAFKPIVRSKTVHVRSDKGNYEFRYAPLEEVLGAITPALSENGLTLFQPLGHDGSDLVLSTVLAHASGAYISTRMVLPQGTTGQGRDGNRFERAKTAQEIGSAITYMRRYMVNSILGVSAEEDDDGAAGEDMPRTITEKARPAPTPPKIERSKPAVQSAPKAEPKPVADVAARGIAETQDAQPQNGAQQAVLDAVDAAATAMGAPTEPPPEGTKPSKESMTEMRKLIEELQMGKMVPEWTQKLLGIPPAKITLQSQVDVLIADLKMRKAATA